MEVAQAEAALRRRLRGRSFEHLTGPAAFDVMLSFYLEERARGVIDAGGDMLLFQWGDYTWDDPSFMYDVTRQFITGTGEDDDDFWQLSLTVHYAVSEETQRLGTGSRWCGDSREAAEFATFVREHPVTAYVSSVAPLRADLQFGQAG